MLDATWKVAVVMGVAVLIRVLLHFDKGLPEGFRTSTAEFVDSALIALALVFFIIRPFVIQAFYIPSKSMERTLLVNDRILVSKFIYNYRQPEIGDVVVFKSPPSASQGGTSCDSCGATIPVPSDFETTLVLRCPNCGASVRVQKEFIKRLIGRPGDRIRVTGGTVYVNGVPLDEPYIAEPPSYEYPDRNDLLSGELEIAQGEVIVPSEHYFVLGDNRNDSNDSHRWGFVPAENLLGKAVVIFWSHPPREPIAWKRLGWELLLGHPSAKLESDAPVSLRTGATF